MTDLALHAPIATTSRPRTLHEVIRSAAPSLGVRCDSVGDDARLLRVRRGDRTRLVPADGCNESHVAVTIARDADLTRSLLMEAGIPVPKVLVVSHADEAALAAALWAGPVAVAPIDARGRMAALAPFDVPEDIRGAFLRAAFLRGRAVVMGPLHGCDHRVLVVGGVAIAAARCVPPVVKGDGRRTVRQLIEAENDDRSGKRRAAIPCDGPTELTLARQGLTFDSTARAGKSVRLREACDHRAGAAVEDVTAEMSPALARDCVRAARQIGLDVAEVSVVCRHISHPLASQDGCIVAVDPSPDVAIHLAPDGGDVHRIGPSVMDLLFPEPQA